LHEAGLVLPGRLACRVQLPVVRCSMAEDEHGVGRAGCHLSSPSASTSALLKQAGRWTWQETGVLKQI